MMYILGPLLDVLLQAKAILTIWKRNGIIFHNFGTKLSIHFVTL